MEWEAKPQIYVRGAGKPSRQLQITCNEEIQENILILRNGFPYM